MKPKIKNYTRIQKTKKQKNKTKPKNQLQFETKENRKFGVDAE